jgi:hypothetical protein
MKKVLTSVAAVLLCCGVAIAAEQAAAPAAGAPAAKAACPAKKGAKCTIKGTVESIDAAAMKLVVKDAKDLKAAPKEIMVTADTKITGKKVKSIADIAVGDSVEVKMVGDVVKKISVKKPKPAKAEKAPKAEKVEKGEKVDKK